MESGNTSFGTPLSYVDSSLTSNDSPSGFSAVLKADAVVLDRLGHYLPSQAFAIEWWLPLVLVLIIAPLWFRMLTVRYAIGIPTSILLVLSPVAAWWSWNPLWILGISFTASFAFLLGLNLFTRSRSKISAIVLFAVSALCTAKLVTFYVPWVIPIAVCVLSTTIIATFFMRPRGLHLFVSAVLFVTLTSSFLLYLFVSQHEALEVLQATIYPGSRRSVGEQLPLGHVFGGPLLAVDQLGIPLIGTNQSEISTSYTLMFVLGPIVLLTFWRRVSTYLRSQLLALTTLCVLLLSWTLLNWPLWASNLFPINLSPAVRIAGVVGFGAIMTFAFAAEALCVGNSTAGKRRFIFLFSLSLMGLILATSIASFHDTFAPELSPVILVAIAIAFILVVGLVLASPGRLRSWIPLLAFASMSVVAVNPLQLGLGNLRDGETANLVRSLQLQLPGRWATDGSDFDAILMANAIPSLSGQQWIGPDSSSWQLLDPRRESQASWNRGASYVTFKWEPGLHDFAFSNPAPDTILVTMDPCAARLDSFGVNKIASRFPLGAHCLRPVGEVLLGGATRYLYQRQLP